VGILAGATAVAAAVAVVGVAAAQSNSGPEGSGVLAATASARLQGTQGGDGSSVAPSPDGLDSDAVFLGASLKGKNEVPIDDGPRVGDEDGKAVSVLRIAGNQICYALEWSKIGAPTLAHIHVGEKGENGDVAVPLFGTALPGSLRAVAGCVTADEDVVKALEDKPEDFYANVHTEKFDGGAVRGQYRALDRSVQLDGFIRGKLLTVGDGENEVPEAGDVAASFIASVTPKGERAEFAVKWFGFGSPTIGHIHRGKSGKAGDPVVDLFEAPDGLSPELFAVAGVSDKSDRSVIEEISQNPGGFYFNLHSSEFPAGAARGQLEENGEIQIGTDTTAGKPEDIDSSVISEDTDGSGDSNNGSGDTSILDENVAVKSEDGTVVRY
jgi:hypothetical protein